MNCFSKFYFRQKELLILWAKIVNLLPKICFSCGKTFLFFNRINDALLKNYNIFGIILLILGKTFLILRVEKLYLFPIMTNFVS